MKTEIVWLAASAALTGVLWLPYVLDRMKVWGLADTVGYPANPKPLDPWAERLRRAHANAVENLVVFGVLVLAAQDAGISNGVTQEAAMLYFWARLVHAIAYTAAWPWVRTLGFAVGFFCQAAFAWQILLK